LVVGQRAGPGVRAAASAEYPFEKGEGNCHPRRNNSATVFVKAVSWLDGSTKDKYRGRVRRGKLPHAVSASLAWPVNPQPPPFPSHLKCVYFTLPFEFFVDSFKPFKVVFFPDGWITETIHPKSWGGENIALKIGMMNNPRMDLLAEIAWARKNDFNFLDLTLEPSAAQPGHFNVQKVRKALSDSGLEIIGHTAYYLPLASPYASLRQAALEELRLALQAFADLGAAKMTIHPDKSIPFALGAKGVLEKNLEAISAIDQLARPLGIQILVENMDRTFNTVEELRRVFSQMPYLGFHLDVGHANLNVGKNRTKDFLEAFHTRLVHVHLSDNFGKSEDLHLPLGAGNIDWKKMVTLLKDYRYDGTITLEIFSLERNYLLSSRDKLEELWRK